MNIHDTYREFRDKMLDPQTSALLTIAAVINEASEKQPVREGLMDRRKRPPLTPEQKAQMMEMARSMMSSPPETFDPAAKSTESIPEVKP